MAVGYNNFDVDAMTAAGVQGTNTPDVLTETTADFGFALLMATARRMTESEHFLRAGKWTKWSYDMFAGSDIHGSTLGIMGMGRIGQGIAKRGAHGFGMKVIYHNRSRLAPALEAECKATLRGQGRAAAHRRPPGAGGALQRGIAPHHWRGRAGADEAHRHAHQHCARRHRGRRGAGRGAARARIAAAGLDVFEGEPKRAPRSADRAQRGADPAHRQRHVPTRRPWPTWRRTT
jgi:gluconate 2-dehydrogenase